MKIAKVKSIKKIENASLRYDIEVHHTHNFFANRILVHNSNCQIVWLSPDIDLTVKAQVNIGEWISVWDDDYFLGYCAVASKGLGAQGMFFKDNEANVNNVYLRAAKLHLVNIARHFWCQRAECSTIVGEVFGKNVQPGFDYGLGEVSMNCFDVYDNFRGRGKYIDDELLDLFSELTKVPRVPLVYRGPFSFNIMHVFANDEEKAFSNCKHIREGVIVKPVKERYHPTLGRVALKHRSEKYMMKSTGEEFN
jgi:RNA ligase (TIGR02306 family)